MANKERLGDVANNITLSAGGILRSQGVDFGSTRDIILSGTGGSIINDGSVNTFGGKITGAGNLQIGNAAYNTLSNRFVLTSSTSDYTGNTTIHNGSLELGANNALPSGTVLTIGGNNSTAQMFMEGFDLEIAGLSNTGTNTKQFSSTAASILTINVADGETYSYNGNVVGTAGTVSIVKTGLGRQNFNRASGNTSFIGDISANAGTLMWTVNGNAGAVSVASGATLQIGNSGTSGGVGAGSGAANVGDANITNNGSLSILRSAAYTYDGVISGAGDATYSAGNGALTFSQAQTYTGNTTIDKAVFTAQMANALSADSAVTLGGAGGGTSAFDVNGFDQEIGGLAFAAGSHTREVQNNGGSTATLTLNVATGESYQWNANFNGTNAINIIKTGDGTQIFGRNGGYSTALGDITVTGGELIWNNNNAATQTGAVLVSGGNLEVTQSMSVTDFTVSTGATSSFAFKVSDWAGIAQTGFNQVAASGTFSVADAASYTVVVDDANLSGFDDSTQSFIIATAPTVSATTAEFVLDATAFTLGSGGTWSLDVVGTDVVLTFTSTAISDPYDTWATGGELFDNDANNDGVSNGLAFILGAGDPNADALSLLPDGAATGGDLVMTFDIVNPIAPAVLSLEYSNDLTGSWTSVVVPSTAGTTTDGLVEFVITGTDPLTVTATIDSSAASVDGSLFGRLSAVE